MYVHACPALSDFLPLHGLKPSRLCCPCGFPGRNTGVGCYFLLQRTFPTQGLNLRLLHWQVDSLLLNHLGSLMGDGGRKWRGREGRKGEQEKESKQRIKKGEKPLASASSS